MQEAIGLAHAAEIPVVIVDCQRGGPSTGMPTKHEQSDVMAALFGTHGDSPRIALAPSSAEEAFYDTVLAFNLADRYQCPVFVMMDLSLSLNKQTVEELDLVQGDHRPGRSSPTRKCSSRQQGRRASAATR